MILEPVVDRTLAIAWTVSHLGIPKGFDKCTYRGWVNRLMDEADYNEAYLVDDNGSPLAYFAWCLSEDIHHRGTIFDVTNVVVKPGVSPKVHAKLMREIYALAECEGCRWVSRCQHKGDTIVNIFKEINHG